MNDWLECYQICMSISLGQNQELIRFWWPWHYFQGHYKSALYKLFGNLCIVMQMEVGFLSKKSWLGFGDLDLIFKLTLKHICQILIGISIYHRNFVFSDRQVWANNVDPDQTAPRGAAWWGSTLFAIPSASLDQLLCSKMIPFQF